MSDSVILATKLTKKFADFTAINEISLNIGRGQIYGFLGPNGCGKSTTIRLLTGLLTPSQGVIEVLGYSIPKQAEQLRLKTGYMTQKFSLYDDLTVQENLKFIGQIYGINGHRLRQQCEKQLTTYGLLSLRSRIVAGLSGGQKQRLSLAAATIHQPELLFLDEPTSAVDPENRRDFWEKLFDLSELGTTILVTTHYMDEAERCHQLAIMEAGQIRANGPPQQLMQQLGVNIVEVKADGLRELKTKFLKNPAIRSAAQLGVRLRVLIYDHIEQPITWLQQNFSELNNAELTLARPTLEDVFVSVTGGNS